MSAKIHIAVVDDNPPQRMILTRLLEGDYEVSVFENGEQFLASSDLFAAVLLDIEMPGLNGYETCRKLRSRPGGKEVPVIFVSAHVTAPERVDAYEAGGDDFVTKPITANELRHKLKGVIEHRLRVQDLAAQSSNAQQVAFTAMISMGDLGVVINFLRNSYNNSSYEAIAQQLIEAISAWGLLGIVQVRGRNGHLDRSSAGDMSPLQASVLDTMREMGRIFELGSRAIVNFEHVSLLIQNLPTDDPDKVGRLRDHLAVLAEGADMRVAALDAVDERNLQKIGVATVLSELRNALQRINEQNRDNRANGQSQMLESLEHLARTLRTLGLTETQEGYVDDLVKDALDETRHYFDEAQSIESEFGEALNQLERLARADYSR